jgi:PhoPQ-activated pathogenicity-related protein
VCYRNDSNNNGYLYAQILTISGTTITVSTPVQCNSYNSYYISATLVSSDKVLVCYRNVSGNSYLYAQILTISGTTITASTPVRCNNSYFPIYISTTLVSSDKVLVCYRNNNNNYYLYAQILTISGTTITVSTPVQCNSNNSDSITTTLVSSDKVLVCYCNSSNNGYLYAQILTISGTTITASTPVQCNSYSSIYISTTLVSSDKVLVCYSNNSNGYYLYAQILTISGTTITASTPVQCNSNNSYDISTTLVSSDKVLVCYCNGSNNSYLYAQIITG